MNRVTLPLLSRITVAVVVPLVLATSVAGATAWSVVPSPSPSVSGNDLNAVTVVGARLAWAVGDSTASNGAGQTLIEQWDGAQWSVVPSPNPSPFHNGLSGVSAVAAQDVWAVGSFSNALDTPQTLIEHWDGSTWNQVASSNVGPNTNVLTAVSAISSTDVWAVGQYDGPSGFLRTLVEHWNGQQWSVIPSPNVGTHNNRLHGVAAISATDVWAVGEFLDPNGTAHSVIEHWNGQRWTIVTFSLRPSVLNAISAVSATDIWAVGQVMTSTLTEHWDGAAWRIVPSPNPSTNNNILSGVASVSASNVWAVGAVITSGPSLTLIEHWNGARWSVVPSPNPSANLNFLSGAAADPRTGLTWAVGTFFTDSGTGQTLTEIHLPSQDGL